MLIEAAQFRKLLESESMGASSTLSPILEHLRELAQEQPHVCVVADEKGHMCAWGLRNVGGARRAETDIFNLAYVENFNLTSKIGDSRSSKSGQHVNVFHFPWPLDGSAYTMLVHHYDGSVEWLEATATELFDPSWRTPRLRRLASWTGHKEAIAKIIRNNTGRAVLSRTSENSGLVWKQLQSAQKGTLFRKTVVKSADRIRRTCLTAGGNFVINLHDESVSLWDARDPTASRVAIQGFKCKGRPLCLLLLPSTRHDLGFRYVALITSEMQGTVWEITLPPLTSSIDDIIASSLTNFEEFCTFDLESPDDIKYILPVDPAGSTLAASEFLDTFAKDVMISYTTKGTINAWTARLNLELRTVDWLMTSTVETRMENIPLASGSSIRKVAAINAERQVLTIWDLRGAQLEFSKDFGLGETIHDLDWTSTPDDQSILAVGFTYKVVILAQVRYDYLDRGPAWASIREIVIRDLTPHPIGDSTWLGDGHFVIGAGNQLFVYDKIIEARDDTIHELKFPIRQHAQVDLFDIVTLINGPLPVYHPQFLSQCILSGKFEIVQTIIVELDRTLKFYSEGDDLASFLNVSVHEFLDEDEVRVKRSRQKFNPDL